MNFSVCFERLVSAFSSHKVTYITCLAEAYVCVLWQGVMLECAKTVKEMSAPRAQWSTWGGRLFICLHFIFTSDEVSFPWEELEGARVGEGRLTWSELLAGI